MVVGFEGLYKVSEYGKIVSEKTGKIVSTKTNNRKYRQVHLYKQNILHMKLLHRIVAEAFIPNLQSLPQVNHIDENKENNHYSNLEWCNNLYNRHHGTGIQRSVKHHDYKSIGIKNGRPVIQRDKQGNCLLTFYSVKEAERQTGISESNIRQCCCSTRRTAGGYKWQYA